MTSPASRAAAAVVLGVALLPGCAGAPRPRAEAMQGPGLRALAAVVRAEEWVDTVDTQRTANSDGTGVLKSLELLALRRRAFVQIARDYNRRIARYAELAAPSQVQSEQLVAMLIKVDGRSGTATRSSVPPTPGNRQSRSGTEDSRQTFADEWAPVGSGGEFDTPQRDEAVAPASAEEMQTFRPKERSLLVNPQ